MNAPLAVASLAALVVSACGPSAQADSVLDALPATAQTPAEALVQPAGAYRFDQPVARFEMPEALREISALTVLDETHLGAVQDEDGDLYVLEIATGRVSAVVPFGPPGDYEGVELAGDRLFVLRADGALLELTGWTRGEARTTVHETGLGARDCDAEGLGYSAARSQLLIACKKDTNGRNPVHGFRLDTNTLTETPVLWLDPDAVPGEKNLRPSALAVHPVTGHTVVLSSKRESLVSLGASGGVEAVWDLGPAAFEQPEGLAFLPNGDALVSSEGKDGPAVLLRFAYEPVQ